MPTTVRVEDTVKEDLDRLQGEILAEKGERLSHSELLARLLRYARRNHPDFMHDDRALRRPTRAQIARWAARLHPAKASSRARDVDKALYSERP